MADDSVQVKIGADVSAAKSGMEDGAASIKASLDGIKAALENFGGANQKITSDALKNNADLSRSFLELKASTTSGFNAITGVIERFRGVLGTLAAALAGGALFKGAVDSLLKLEDEVRGLEIVMGASAEKATALAVQLRVAGVSAETFEQMATKVGRVIKTQPEEFARFGIAIKDANGNLLPMDQILDNVYAGMQQFKAGTDQDIVAMNLLGRSSLGFASDMQRFKAAAADSAEALKRMGIEMGPDRQAQVEQYRRSVNIVGLEFSAIGEKIGAIVLPKLQGLAEWMSDVGPNAAKVITFAVQVLASGLQVLGTIAGNIVVFIIAKFQNLVTSAIATWQAIKEAAAFNFGAIPGIVSAANAKIEANNKALMDSMVAQWAATAKKWDAIWGDQKAPTGLPSAIPGSGSKNAPTGKMGGGEDMLSKFKAELDDLNLAQGAFNQLSKLQEMEFWETKLALVRGNGAKEIALRAEINREILRDRNEYQREGAALEIAALHEQEVADKENKNAQIADAESLTAFVKGNWGEQSVAYQKALGEETAIREAWAKKEKAIAKEVADIQRKMADETSKYNIEINKLAEDQKVALGLESNAQRLEQERAFVDQQHAIDLAAINVQLADESLTLVQHQKLLDDKLKMEQAYQKQVTQIANAAELEREKYAIEAEKAIVSSITDIFANLITNAKNWKQTLLDGFKALDDQLVKIAANQLVQQYLGAGTSGGGFLSSLTSSIFGSGAGGGAATLSTAGSTLTVAGTGLTTAATALSAAAVALQASGASSGAAGIFGGGGGFGFGDLLGSFDVGTPYVPHDMIAMIHKGEAIIPAAYNSNGSAGNVNQRNTFVFNSPVDTRTQTQIALQVQRASQMAMRRSR